MTVPADPPRRAHQPPDHYGDRAYRVVEIPPERAADLASLTRSDDLTVGIVGLGYVGLPTALAFHAIGARVLGLENSEARIDAIRAATVDLVADDVRRLADALRSDQFTVVSDARALTAVDAIVVCVPTPVDEHQVPDLEAITAACATVVANARPGQLIILTSTSYVGCTREIVAEPLEARGFRVGLDIHVAFSPERIDPGNVRFSQSVVPRVVGGATPGCTTRAVAVIGKVAPTHTVSSMEVAEFTKLYESSFRAVNIAFANEMESASRSLGLAFDEIVEAASTKPFGFMPFRAGIGVGGHCIPCDPHYLLWQLRAMHEQAPILDRAMAGIASRPGEIARRAAEFLAEHGIAIRNARVLVVGVSYKPGVDDIRETPALELIETLLGHGATVEFTDPRVPVLRLSDGRFLRSLDDPEGLPIDLAIVHALHPGVDYGWLAGQPILDPSGRVAEVVRTPGQARLTVAG